MDTDQTATLIRDMRASFDRLQQMVADLHPTDGAAPALRGGIDQLEEAVDE